MENRNHRFIHRRGLISFELAKLYSEDSNDNHYRDYYLNEAYDLFLTKQLVDTFSSYSYVDFIKLLIWEVKNLDLDNSDKAIRQIKIEELLEVASRLVTDNIERIHTLSSDYASLLNDLTENSDYKEYLDLMYDDFHLKPYACILLYNHYNLHRNEYECQKLVEEMEYYQENFEVVKFLFKYYGRMLFDANVRIKLMRLSRENPDLEKDNSLRYCFFNFIAETYNRQFSEGRKYLHEIQTRGFYLSPAYHEVWLDAIGDPQVFDGIIYRKNSWDRMKSVKILNMQQVIKLKKGDYDKFPDGTKIKVHLHFYLYGLVCELLDKVG